VKKKGLRRVSRGMQNSQKHSGRPQGYEYRNVPKLKQIQQILKYRHCHENTHRYDDKKLRNGIKEIGIQVSGGQGALEARYSG